VGGEAEELEEPDRLGRIYADSCANECVCKTECENGSRHDQNNTKNNKQCLSRVLLHEVDGCLSR
jgi:hypothetical protein